jgi:spore coat protein H
VLNILLLVGYLCHPAAAAFSGPGDSLRFATHSGTRHVVDLEMPAVQYKKVTSTTGQKLVLKNTGLKFNGEAIVIKDIHLHGNTTLYYERKSFSVDADQKIKLCKGCKPLDAFYLISLSMDKNYFHNRLCFDLLAELDLFHLQYEFVEVRINGNSQGIYLLLQRPQDWSKKSADSPFILRRGVHHAIAKEKAQKDLEKENIKGYRNQFAQIYKLIHQYSGEELYNRLNEILHVDDYLRWLALNYLVKNGDYSDELYFYIDPASKRYRIIPWDYDDVFKQEPHEGMAAWRLKMEASSLVFSSEDDLDVKIAHDPYLYGQYLLRLQEVMDRLSQEKLETLISAIYGDLYPYFSDDTILAALSRDGYTTTLARLKQELETVHQYFTYQRTALRKR